MIYTTSIGSTLLALLKNSYVFWICFLLFVLTTPLFLFSHEQGSLLIYFSEHRTEWSDVFFRYFTKIGEAIGYVVALVVLLFKRFRYALILPIIGILVTIASFALKGYFLHPRPSVYYRKLGQLSEIQIVDGVQLLGGLSSFPSGHTMSGFALFSFLAFVFPKKNTLQLILFIGALFIGISRIYLVQHFLKDIYLGAIMGVLIAVFVFVVQAKIPTNTQHWVDRKIVWRQ